MLGFCQSCSSLNHALPFSCSNVHSSSFTSTLLLAPALFMHVMQELEVSEAQIWFITPMESAARFTAQSVGYKCEDGKPNVRQSVAYVPQD
jgi:hypothetical protein